jgi:hypothetical protein
MAPRPAMHTFMVDPLKNSWLPGIRDVATANRTCHGTPARHLRARVTE